MNFFLTLSLGLSLSFATAGQAWAAPLRIVAAENFYADIATQIGGHQVSVTSILNDPSQDPHMFEASPAIAIALSRANLVIFNGADYDPWVRKLIAGAGNRQREVIDVAKLVGATAGGNPHLWYNPATMIAVAQQLTAMLRHEDPAHDAYFAGNLARFRHAMRPLQQTMADMRRRFAGTPVTATEPLFGYMARALGLTMRNSGFQLAVMNNVEPGASEVARFENDLRERKVAALISNSQVTDAMTAHMRGLARSSGVPVVGMTETQPRGMTYPQWMQSQLDALAKALGNHP